MTDLFGPDHACLGCGKVHPGARAVELHDGRVVSSYSEDFRHEAEAISILAMPTKIARQAYLSNVADRRGQKTADALKVTITAIWEKRRSRSTA